MMNEKHIQLVNEKGTAVWYRRLDEAFFDKLRRILELLPDEDALTTLDKIIEELEAPKLEMAERISKELMKDGNMTDFLQEALTALPMKELKEMDKKIKSLTMKREPDADCITVHDGKKSHTLHL